MFAAMFTLGVGVAMAIPAAQLGAWWAWVAVAVVLALGGAGTFVAQRSSAQLVARAMHEWEDRTGA